MSDTVEIKLEKYEQIHNGFKKGFVTEIDTSLIHKGHRAHAFAAGHDSRNPEVEELNQDCKNLVEINNNQAKVIDGLQAEIEKLKEIITQVHSWIVCSAITTPEDMMENADWIEDITNLKINMLYNVEE